MSGAPQLQLSFEPAVTPRGDGSYIVTPGKPILPKQRISPAEFARQKHISVDTVYRWINDGTIPTEHVIRRGPKLLLISVEALNLVDKPIE